ncbi:MAG: enoyl-CoA hydratase/isomerase family protein, partial [Planctomycetota bacterium]
MTTPEPFQIDREHTGDFAGICTIRLVQPGKPVVVLDLPLIQRLEATLSALPKDAAGLVLASASERVFIAGADLKTIQDATDDQLHRYLAYASGVFAMISALPYPTVAAINGAALGGGLELAMHCDALVAAPSFSGKPYPIGLPEAGLSICPGWGGTNLLPARLDPATAIQMTATGKPMNFDEAKAAGMFDAVAPSFADLIPTAMRWIVDRRAKGRIDRDTSPLRCISRPTFATAAL